MSLSGRTKHPCEWVHGEPRLNSRKIRSRASYVDTRHRSSLSLSLSLFLSLSLSLSPSLSLFLSLSLSLSPSLSLSLSLEHSPSESKAHQSHILGFHQAEAL